MGLVPVLSHTLIISIGEDGAGSCIVCTISTDNTAVRHRIDFLNVRNAKHASTLHAQTLVTTNS